MKRYVIVKQLGLVREKPDGAPDIVLDAVPDRIPGVVPEGVPDAVPVGKPGGITSTVIMAPGLAKGKGALI